MWENESKYLFWHRVSKALGHGSHAPLLVICSDIEYHAVPVCGRVVCGRLTSRQSKNMDE